MHRAGARYKGLINIDSLVTITGDITKPWLQMRAHSLEA